MGAPATKSGPTSDNEGFLVLQGELFWKWRAVAESVQRVDAEYKLKNAEVEAVLTAHPEVARVLGERAGLMQQSVTARQEYMRVQADLEAHFGFPMKNVSIDDVSGRVHRLDAPEPAPPVTNGVNGHAKAPKEPTTAKKKSPPKKTRK